MNREKSDAVDTRQTPPYQDLCTPDVPFGYEARSYNASVWASVEIVSMSSDWAVLSAKPLLEEYFMGHNDQSMFSFCFILFRLIFYFFFLMLTLFVQQKLGKLICLSY